MVRTYNIRCPIADSVEAEGTTTFANGTKRTVEYVGNGLVRVTWDDSGFWEKH